MSKQNPIDDLREVLIATGVVLPLRSGSRGNNHSLLCRPVRGQDQVWLKAVEELLKAFEEPPEGFPEVELHLGRQYILKNGKMAAGWFIGLTCRKVDLGSAIGVFREVLEGVEPVDEGEPGEDEDAPQAQFQSGYREMNPRTHAQLSGAPPQVRELRGRTTSPPRSMEGGMDPIVPRRDVRLKTVENRIKVSPSGKRIHVEVKEIPLAHVFGEMGVENERGRGVFSDVDSATPKILRNRR